MQAFAFFDVDDSVLSIKSMFSFQQYWYERVDSKGMKEFNEEIAGLRKERSSREFINRRYYTYFAGRDVDHVTKVSEEWFKFVLAEEPELFHEKVVNLLKRHQRSGMEPVLVSGSFPEVLAPVARHLGVNHVLSTTMVIQNGKFTGEILHPQTIGEGKKDALLAFLEKQQAPSEHCFAYGDDISDQFMLSAVGWPIVIKGNREMERYAEKAGWPVLALRPNDEWGSSMESKVIDAAVEMLELEERAQGQKRFSFVTERWFELATEIFVAEGGGHSRKSFRIPTDLRATFKVNGQVVDGRLREVSLANVTAVGPAFGNLKPGDSCELHSVQGLFEAEGQGLNFDLIRCRDFEGQPAAALEISVQNSEEMSDMFNAKVYHNVYLWHLQQLAALKSA